MQHDLPQLTKDAKIVQSSALKLLETRMRDQNLMPTMVGPTTQKTIAGI
jgi:hypothetical protein